ncbi:hypothetical protein JIN84_22625 [Luteolibacter yonseiensis]|uniref:Pilus assembly protein PilP n=1 Tax=Luteolibacter yonseiensis TaxID=1144680 RepID=A0A934R917_9BACT|nr:hypothetical protein [Luteolibacter yonseiensis]MBK1818431.1 hypothetical protein [Luteolibacter yonseiensis]
MNRRFAAFLMLAFLALAPSAFASGKKESKASITFHMETEATDNPKMIFPQLANGQQRYFRRMPEIGTKDIVSFSPFPSEAGDYGVVVRLKSNAAARLSAITNANQGKWMISQVNGNVVNGFLIDKQVDDGVVVIWQGVTLADITLLDEELPRTGANGKKKKK